MKSPPNRRAFLVLLVLLLAMLRGKQMVSKMLDLSRFLTSGNIGTQEAMSSCKEDGNTLTRRHEEDMRFCCHDNRSLQDGSAIAGPWSQNPNLDHGR